MPCNPNPSSHAEPFLWAPPAPIFALIEHFSCSRSSQYSEQHNRARRPPRGKLLGLWLPVALPRAPISCLGCHCRLLFPLPAYHTLLGSPGATACEDRGHSLCWPSHSGLWVKAPGLYVTLGCLCVDGDTSPFFGSIFTQAPDAFPSGAVCALLRAEPR